MCKCVCLCASMRVRVFRTWYLTKLGAGCDSLLVFCTTDPSAMLKIKSQKPLLWICPTGTLRLLWLLSAGRPAGQECAGGTSKRSSAPTTPTYWPQLLALSAEELGVLKAALSPLCARTRSKWAPWPISWVLFLALSYRKHRELLSLRTTGL